MMKPVAAILAVYCLVAVARAADAPTTAPSDIAGSPLATSAMTREQAAVKKAEDAYVQAVVSAKRQCLRDLDAAMKTSMKSGNLDSANKIDVLKKQLSKEIDELLANGRSASAASRA